jgi:hypothetical protein
MTPQQQSDLAIDLIRTAIQLNQKKKQSVQVIYSGDCNWVEILIYKEKGSLESIFHETVNLDKYDAEQIDLVEEALDDLLQVEDDTQSTLQALLPNP